MRPRSFFPGLLLITMGGYALRVHYLANWGIWQDEIALWMEVLGMDSWTADPILPRTLIYLWMWIAGDTSLFALHFVPILTGGAAVAAFGAFLRELARPAWGEDKAATLGWIGASLFSVWPAAIYYSVEARPYAFLLLAVPLLYLTFLRVVRDPRAINFALYSASVAFTSNCHYITAHILVGFFIVIIWETFRNRTYRKTALLVAATSVGCLPALLTMRVNYVLPVLEPTPVLSVARYLGTFFWYDGPAFLNAPGAQFVGIPLFLLVVAYGGHRLWLAGLKRELAIMTAVSVTSLCMVYGFLGEKGNWGHFPVARYLVHLLIPMGTMLSVAVLVAVEKWRRAAPLVLALAVLLVAPTVLENAQADFRNAATILRSSPPMDGVVVIGERALHAFGYYYGSPAGFHQLSPLSGGKISLREVRPIAGRGGLRTMWDVAKTETTLEAGRYAFVVDTNDINRGASVCQSFEGRFERSESPNLGFCHLPVKYGYR